MAGAKVKVYRSVTLQEIN